MLETFPIMLALCLCFPALIMFKNYASIINTDLALRKLNYHILIYIIILFVNCKLTASNADSLMKNVLSLIDFVVVFVNLT